MYQIANEGVWPFQNTTKASPEKKKKKRTCSHGIKKKVKHDVYAQGLNFKIWWVLEVNLGKNKNYDPAYSLSRYR